MVDVTLIALTDAELEDFIRADVADFADYVEHLPAGPMKVAAEQEHVELENRLRHEHSTADAHGHRRWAALAADGTRVGWLWVTPPMDDSPADGAFLYQILVKPSCRRKGFGRAMLAVLEASLADDGDAELRLHVNDSNHRAQALYSDAGYERIAQLEGMTELRKRLSVSRPSPS